MAAPTSGNRPSSLAEATSYDASEEQHAEQSVLHAEQDSDLEGVTIRTHKNSGERIITIELLRQVAHLPQQQAADKLNVGNTRFKLQTATRELGMRAWPYRKIKSIRSLMTVLQQNPDRFEGEAETLIESLHDLEDATFRDPTTPLAGPFKKFRQSAYKLKHKHKQPSE